MTRRKIPNPVSRKGEPSDEGSAREDVSSYESYDAKLVFQGLEWAPFLKQKDRSVWYFSAERIFRKAEINHGMNWMNYKNIPPLVS